MSISEPDLTISFHPEVPEEVGAECPLCAAGKGLPCTRSDLKTESHVERRAAWLMQLGRKRVGGHEGISLWNQVLHVVEEMPEGDQLRWKKNHLAELKQIAFDNAEDAQ